MKIMIASDIHGSAGCCRQLLERFREERADRLLLLGDLLYHGPRNDLPEDYAPKQVTALLNEYRDVLYCVRGNCEAEVDQMVLAFPVMADYALLPVGSRMVFVTHGHVFNQGNRWHKTLTACFLRKTDFFRPNMIGFSPLCLPIMRVTVKLLNCLAVADMAFVVRQ